MGEKQDTGDTQRKGGREFPLSVSGFVTVSIYGDVSLFVPLPVCIYLCLICTNATLCNHINRCKLPLLCNLCHMQTVHTVCRFMNILKCITCKLFLILSMYCFDILLLLTYVIG